MVYKLLNVLTFLFQTIQFSMSAVYISNTSIGSINRTLSGVTTPGLSGPGAMAINVWFGLILWYINHCRLFNTRSIFIHINSSISNNSVLYKYKFLFRHILNVKTVLFQAIYLSISTQFNSVGPTGWTLSGVTTPGQKGPGSNGNEGVLRIPHYWSHTIRFLSDISMTHIGGVLPLYRDGVGLFCSPSQLSHSH